MGGKLSPIVRADVIGRSMPLEQLGEHSQDVIASKLALDVDRQALAAMLIDDGQHAERLAIVSTVHHEVVAPDMAGILRPQPDAGSIVKPQPPALGLLVRYLQPLATPDALDPLGVHLPALIAQRRSGTFSPLTLRPLRPL